MPLGLDKIPNPVLRPEPPRASCLVMVKPVGIQDDGFNERAESMRD